MAKNKSVKLEPKSPKRKKSGLSESPVSVEDIVETKSKKKKDCQVEFPSVIKVKHKKNLEKTKKRKKKEGKKEQTQPKQTEITELSSCPDGTQESQEDKLEGELSPEERRVLERKVKKILKKEEKKRLKAEGHSDGKTVAAGPSASQQALEYLTCWAENRSVWKFQKTRQTWLLQHMFDSEKIPDEKFSLLLQYLEGLRGMARDTTVEKAMSMVEESGRAPEDAVVQQRAHRAREIIQMLS
uniref:Zmp:0000000624 n=1 Tax=Oryzias latipes TaxID=8090 RepID=A0A3P9HL54_ORYLA